MSLGVYLESQKQSIATNIAIQNAMKKQNPNSSNSIDMTDSRVSIFSAQIREAIREKAASCNDISNQIILKKEKNQAETLNSCSDVTQKIGDLQALTAWANAATQEIASIPGISSSAINAVKQAMSQTMQFASAAINNSVSQANEALSKIKVVENNKIQSSQNEAAIQETQNNLQTVAENPVENTENTQQNLVAKSETAGTPAADVPKTDAPKVDAPKADAPKVEAAKIDAPKVDAPKVDVPKAETLKANTDTTKITEPVKFDITA